MRRIVGFAVFFLLVFVGSLHRALRRAEGEGRVFASSALARGIAMAVFLGAAAALETAVASAEGFYDAYQVDADTVLACSTLALGVRALPGRRRHADRQRVARGVEDWARPDVAHHRGPLWHRRVTRALLTRRKPRGTFTSNMPDEEADKGFRDLADRGLGAAVDRVPDGEFKRFLKQAGLVGLALSVLLANVPASAAMNAVVDADTKLDMSKIELYWRVLVLFAPFVLFFGAIAYCMTTKWLPQMSGYGYVAVGAGLLLGGMWLSQAIGGLVPLDLVGGPTAGSPGGLGEYIGRVFEAYLVEYGALPVLGGAVEGAFFGYWAGVAFPPE